MPKSTKGPPASQQTFVVRQAPDICCAAGILQWPKVNPPEVGGDSGSYAFLKAEVSDTLMFSSQSSDEFSEGVILLNNEKTLVVYCLGYIGYRGL